MVLLFVICTSQMLFTEFGISNTVTQITRLEPLERDNQGSSLIISGDNPRFLSPKLPPQIILLYVWGPLTQGVSCVAWFTGLLLRHQYHTYYQHFRRRRLCFVTLNVPVSKRISQIKVIFLPGQAILFLNDYLRHCAGIS
jgi:hypothetical protein